ncbi:MAG: aspartate kinase [Candidatus Bipolaricaulia bacterium]
MIVMKFGGTSVGGAAAMEAVMRAVESRRNRQPVVVTSAMRGVTDALSACADAATRGDESGAVGHLDKLAERHRTAARQLLDDGEALTELESWLESQVEEMRTLLKGLAILGELTPRSLDALLAYGERLSTRILQAAMAERGLAVAWIDAREVVVTDRHFGQATPLVDESRERAERLRAAAEAGQIPVTQGFVGATADGTTTTLGRGGSDYSAAFLAQILDAEEIEIWTDVKGVMTADPEVVPEAHPVPELSYAEAAELAYFGAQVLHPLTVAPAVEAHIPLSILNTFEPEAPGTRIVREARYDDHAVKAITAIHGLSLVTIAGRGMLGIPGVAARVFSAVAEEGINVLMISQASSEQSICFLVASDEADRAIRALETAFERERHRHTVDRVDAQTEVAILAVVGAGMKGTPGVAGKLFGTLGAKGINVVSIAQGSSEYNLSIVVDEHDADAAMRGIHREFKLGGGE